MLILDEKTILEKSLNSGITMTFAEFVSFNDIDLDSIKVDKFFHGIKNNIPILMDATMIKYFGYSDDMPEETPKQIRDKNKMQKLSVKTLFDTNFLEYKNQLWWSYSTEEYEKFLKSDHSGNKNIKDLSPEMREKLYPIHKKKGRQPTYILVMPKLIKEGLILCQTEKGKRNRRAYLDLLDAMQIYVQYQCACEGSDFQKTWQKIFSKKYTMQQSIKYFDKKIQEKYRVGCVYYIQEEHTKNIKVGWCWNLPRRLQCLQIANSQKLNVVRCILTQFPYQKEQELHKKYADAHIRGEWYNARILG